MKSPSRAFRNHSRLAARGSAAAPHPPPSATLGNNPKTSHRFSACNSVLLRMRVGRDFRSVFPATGQYTLFSLHASSFRLHCEWTSLERLGRDAWRRAEAKASAPSGASVYRQTFLGLLAGRHSHRTPNSKNVLGAIRTREASRIGVPSIRRTYAARLLGKVRSSRMCWYPRDRDTVRKTRLPRHLRSARISLPPICRRRTGSIGNR